MLSSLERRSERWDHDHDRESARAAPSAAVSLVLRLLGRDPDPAKSREHVLRSVLAERRPVAGQAADLSLLLEDLAEPPMEMKGRLECDHFVERVGLERHLGGRSQLELDAIRHSARGDAFACMLDL